MKRIAVLGALLVTLMLLAGPAMAQSALPEGSVLPEQPPAQVLPDAPPAVEQPSAALADTGFQMSTGALLAVGLLVLGGGALAVGRRRSDQG